MIVHLYKVHLAVPDAFLDLTYLNIENIRHGHEFLLEMNQTRG